MARGGVHVLHPIKLAQEERVHQPRLFCCLLVACPLLAFVCHHLERVGAHEVEARDGETQQALESRIRHVRRERVADLEAAVRCGEKGCHLERRAPARGGGCRARVDGEKHRLNGVPMMRLWHPMTRAKVVYLHRIRLRHVHAQPLRADPRSTRCAAGCGIAGGLVGVLRLEQSGHARTVRRYGDRGDTRRAAGDKLPPRHVLSGLGAGDFPRLHKSRRGAHGKIGASPCAARNVDARWLTFGVRKADGTLDRASKVAQLDAVSDAEEELVIPQRHWVSGRVKLPEQARLVG